MSFATLEEAWGLHGLAPMPAAPAPLMAGGGGSSGGGGGGGGLQQRPAAHLRRPDNGFAPAMAPPRSEDDALAVQNARKFLNATYARFGLAGVARLLPKEAARRLMKKGRGDLVARVTAFLSSPEKLLFVLLCAFALLVVVDGWRNGQGHGGAMHGGGMHGGMQGVGGSVGMSAMPMQGAFVPFS